ncbi:MAG: hypothetical protein ABIK62_02600 [candidate division WOR-3 bacterium]
MNEREKSLELLEAKKITADEAARLLDAVEEPAPEHDRPRRLKVRVSDRTTGKPRVNVTIPWSLVRWGLQFMPESARMELNHHNIDLSQIMGALEQGATGTLVGVDDEADNEHVEVILE